MLITWNRWLWISGSPFFLFIVLFLISQLAYYLFFRPIKPSMMSGAIVMALAIFAITCLPNFELPFLLVLILALELLIVWFYVGFSLIQAYLIDELHHKELATNLALGTWSAGTALLAFLLDQLQPILHGFIILFGILAIVLWLVYFFIIAQWFIATFVKRIATPVNGMVFLATVSTQCVVMVIDRLFGGDIGDWFYQCIVSVGYLLYFAGFFLLILYFVKQYRISFKWSAANTLFYGAMALNGLAIINLNSEIPLWIIHATWWWTIISFVLITGIEIYFWVRRALNQESRKNLFKYATSQWLRLFSICSFYGFAWAYYHQHYNESTFLSWIADYGHYALLVLYLLEGVLWVKYLFSMHRAAAIKH